MKKQQDTPAKRVTVIVNTDHADYSQPVLSRFDFLVPERNDDHKLLRFLCATLRRNKIMFDEVTIGEHRVWASGTQIWTRQRMEGCIRSQHRVYGMLEDLYCEEQPEEALAMS